jgi:cytochrome c biogenesis protein CcdA/thiol-disulfide isomerase/thioredoxin
LPKRLAAAGCRGADGAGAKRHTSDGGRCSAREDPLLLRAVGDNVAGPSASEKGTVKNCASGTQSGAVYGVRMIVLLAIGFVAGAITAVSPCVLPVLPIVFASSAAGEGRRRSLAIIAGLVLSFATFTLTAGALLSTLGLPQDLLRDLAIAALFLLAAALVFPRVGVIVERPLAFMSRRRVVGREQGAFLLGVSLGLVFVPCAGPVLATISVLSAQHRISLDTMLLTLSYALGFGSILLLVALGGQRVARPLRARGPAFRRAMGLVVAAATLAIVVGADQNLQTRLGSYTSSLQRRVEGTSYARTRLAELQGQSRRAPSSPRGQGKGKSIPDYGAAPELRGITHWLNTRSDQPLSLTGLRGRVVLIDFWTYSCINCIRTLPHLRALYSTYHSRGLEIVGVHTPEFAFEHVLSNVREATHDLNVTWPVALDNEYATWNAYSNEYWPAEYLVDRAGHVRHVQFGEGAYEETMRLVRRLLGSSGSARPRTVADATPQDVTTPETYLGYARLDSSRYRGQELRPKTPGDYVFPERLPRDHLSYAGVWTVGPESALAGPGARLRLHFHARFVYVVLGGRGRVRALVNGRPAGSLQVGSTRLYTVVEGSQPRDALLELRLSPGVAAYSFTFG